MLTAKEIRRRYPEASILFVGGKYGPEGDLAAQAGLDFGRHGDKHRLMLSGIRKRLDAMAHPEADVYGLIRYVEYWFERHITEEDKGLGQQLRQSARLSEGKQFVDSFPAQQSSY